MVPRDLIGEIVLVVANAADLAHEKMSAIRPFSEASKRAREATVRVLGYVMSLAPVRAVPTSTLLERMSNRDFAAEVVRSALRQSGALMPRIADLADDRNGALVADALHGKLLASIRGATVNGRSMYADTDAHTTEIIDRLKRRERFERPYIAGELDLRDFTQHFLHLSMPGRVAHMRKYGPMCMWDVSHVTNFSFACSVLHEEEDAPFNSDLYWDTSSATSMREMFSENREFRGDLSTWDVSKVL